MTIASEIARLQGVKTDILGAIAEKKVDVPAGAMLADAPDLIRSIKSGINVKIGQGVYPAVKIGNQIWLAKNLDENLGVLNEVKDLSEQKIINKYLKTNYNVGEKLPYIETSSTGWEYIIVPVLQGTKLTINAKGGNSPRALTIVDEEDVVVYRSEYGESFTDYEYVVPVNGKAIINSNYMYVTDSISLKVVVDTSPIANEWYYNNNEATYKKYGRLYTWDNINDNLSKLGLTKWRWPTKADYDALVALDPTGVKFRSKTFALGTDDYGYSAVPNGIRLETGSFSDGGLSCSGWTSTRPYRYRMVSDSWYTSSTSVSRGCSLRLVLDLNEDGTIPDSNIVLEDVPATTAEPLALANEPIVTEEEE